jgi:hypothetical protein
MHEVEFVSSTSSGVEAHALFLVSLRRFSSAYWPVCALANSLRGIFWHILRFLFRASSSCTHLSSGFICFHAKAAIPL